MDYKYLVHSNNDNIRIITINRPEALNALSQDLLNELEAVVDELSAQNVRVAILTGTGKAFVAGADISVMKNYSSNEAYEFSGSGQKVMSKFEQSKTIWIAAINGFALGGGLELALACDFRYASTNAKLGLPEVSLGIIPGFGGTQRLPRLIGAGLAKELIYTGEMIGAEEAMRLGIVNKVLEPDKLMEASLATARIILSRGSSAIQNAKHSIQDGLDSNLDKGLHIEKESFSELFRGNEAREGLSAFLEKRKPQF
jgi:enoyl-CoA hydratase